MAEKPRAPDPPRKVQAPKVRHKQTQKDGFTMPGTNVLMGVGLAAIVGLVVALLLVLSGSKGGGDVSEQDVKRVTAVMTAAGCTFTASAADGSGRHMSDPDQKVVYKTFPPSSGTHNPTTAIWGNYRNPSDPRQVIHNLEHGGIAIWYGPDITAKDRGGLDGFYDDSPNGVVITPLEDPHSRVSYPKHESLGGKIALTTWTAKADKPDVGTVYVALCPGFDEQAFVAFRDAFRGKGPERFPVSEMTPGVN